MWRRDRTVIFVITILLLPIKLNEYFGETKEIEI